MGGSLCSYVVWNLIPFAALGVGFGAGYAVRRLTIYLDRVTVATNIAVGEEPPSVIRSIEAVETQLRAIQEQSHQAGDISSKVNWRAARLDLDENVADGGSDSGQLEDSGNSRSGRGRRNSNRQRERR